MNKKTTFLLLVLFLLNSFLVGTILFVPSVKADVETLYVNYDSGTKTGWTRYTGQDGDPYLDAPDDNDYVYTSTTGATVGDFGFQDPSGSGTIDSVSLGVYWRASASPFIAEVFLSTDGGSTWTSKGTYTLPTAYGWTSIDVSTELDTWTKITDAMVYFEADSIGGPITGYIDCAKLEVTYTPAVYGPFYSYVDYDNIVAGYNTTFSCKWTNSSLAQLDAAIFSWNSSGTWLNQTVWQNANTDVKWSNITKTLDSTPKKVGFKFYCNNTDGNWNSTDTIVFSSTNTAIKLRPVEDGDLSDWSIYPSTPTTHYDKVDETSPNSDADYINSSVSTHVDLFKLEKLRIDDFLNITKIELTVVVKAIGIEDNYPQHVFKTHGATYYYGFGPVGSYAPWSRVLQTNPNTSQLWTRDEINAMQVGVKRGSGGDEVRVTQINLTVYWNEPSLLIGNWRWYKDDGAEPTQSYAGENEYATAISVVRLRLTLISQATFTGTLQLQYSFDLINWVDIANQGQGGK